MMNKIVVLFSLLWFTSTVADIYVWQDSQGKRHYSDKKQINSTTLKVYERNQYYAIKSVYDGDTLQLMNGKKVRFLGINTPEIAHGNQAAQHGGEEAKRWLMKQLKGKKIRLELGQEKQDKYKRVLAHLFTEQGVHINRELVRLGLASVNIFPPNSKYSKELIAARAEAEKNKRGIWGAKAYKPKSVKQLNKYNKQGWQRIVFRVAHIKKTAKTVYLESTAHRFNARIKLNNLHYFKPLDQYLGKKIEVRGWVNKYGPGYSMLLRHNSALIIL